LNRRTHSDGYFVEMSDASADLVATHLAAIRELFDAAEARGMPLWLENGWAIDARLGRITRPHDDVDVAFPKHREGEYREFLESLGYGGHEFLEYGFLSWRGQVCIDSEPCQLVRGGYSFEGFPADSCPGDKEGVIQGFPIRCVSWETLYFETLGYLQTIPETQWRSKDFENRRMIEANLDEQTKQAIRDLHATRT
jgi:aminoglycoside 2''-adenylyltransferase